MISWKFFLRTIIHIVLITVIFNVYDLVSNVSHTLQYGVSFFLIISYNATCVLIADRNGKI